MSKQNRKLKPYVVIAHQDQQIWIDVEASSFEEARKLAREMLKEGVYRDDDVIFDEDAEITDVMEDE